MPEHEKQDVSAEAQAPAKTALEKFEREQLTRRQALKKFGITSAMATFALFSVDDLARMVGKAMQQRAGDNAVAEQVAQEFLNAGIALADGTNGCGQSGSVSNCQHCANQMNLDTCYCIDKYCSTGTNPDPAMMQHCLNQRDYNFSACCNCWCPGGNPVPSNNTCPSVSSQQPPQGCNC